MKCLCPQFAASVKHFNKNKSYHFNLEEFVILEQKHAEVYMHILYEIIDEE